MELNKQELAISSLKSIIGAIPYVGSLLNELFFDYHSRIQQNRINRLVKEISDRLSIIDEQLINKHYLESEEFYDLTINVFTQARRTSQTEKIRVLASIYISGLLNPKDLENDRHSIIMDILLSIKPTQFEILRFIANNETALVQIDKFESLLEIFQKVTTIREIEKYQFKYYVTDLENKGLITSEGGLSDYNDKLVSITTEDSSPPSIYLTEMGKEFIRLLT